MKIRGVTIELDESESAHWETRDSAARDALRAEISRTVKSVDQIGISIVLFGDSDPVDNFDIDGADIDSEIEDAQRRLRASRERLGLDPDTGKRCLRGGRGVEHAGVVASTVIVGKKLDPGIREDDA